VTEDCFVTKVSKNPFFCFSIGARFSYYSEW
jgi:hypothetical protein